MMVKSAFVCGLVVAASCVFKAQAADPQPSLVKQVNDNFTVPRLAAVFSKMELQDKPFKNADGKEEYLLVLTFEGKINEKIVGASKSLVESLEFSQHHELKPVVRNGNEVTFPLTYEQWKYFPVAKIEGFVAAAEGQSYEGPKPRAKDVAQTFVVSYRYTAASQAKDHADSGLQKYLPVVFNWCKIDQGPVSYQPSKKLVSVSGPQATTVFNVYWDE